MIVLIIMAEMEHYILWYQLFDCHEHYQQIIETNESKYY
jgi:hypothetical protein